MIPVAPAHNRSPAGDMIKFVNILRDIRKLRHHARSEADGLDRAIQALSEAPGRRSGPRHMSQAARKRIANAQRARWARVRAEKAQAR